jgi:hypothetical protein
MVIRSADELVLHALMAWLLRHITIMQQRHTILAVNAGKRPLLATGCQIESHAGTLKKQLGKHAWSTKNIA